MFRARFQVAARLLAMTVVLCFVERPAATAEEIADDVLEIEVSVWSHIGKLAQFNQDHPFNCSTLVEKLDGAPTETGPARRGERVLTSPGA